MRPRAANNDDATADAPVPPKAGNGAAAKLASTKPVGTAGAAATTPPPPASPKTAKWSFPRWWEEWPKLSLRDKILGGIRAIAVCVLVGIPILLLTYHPQPDPQKLYTEAPWLHVQWTAGRLVWTLIIAVIPLALVLMGFYTWRAICPLAFFGRMSEWIGWPDPRGVKDQEMRRKRVPAWLAANYPYVTWGFLTTMLAVRILLINSNPTALAIAFIGLMLLASIVSFRFTGKSWCNYLCPVSTIQRIYTDTDRPNYRNNSQCPSCSGCKVKVVGRCPDINSENDYWQEVKSAPRAWAYYAWPGTVLGFYTWYFLHKPYYGHELYPALLNQGITHIRNFDVVEESHHFGVEMSRVAGHWYAMPVSGTTGTDWAYYMSGDWTRNPEPWREWFTRGWAFDGILSVFGVIPTVVAAPLTLLLFSVVSYGVFKAAEAIWMKIAVGRGIDRDGALEGVRHSLFSIAAFTAFMFFYSFAGAPTFRQLPLQLYSLFYLGVSVVATAILFTRLRRTRTKQLQYDQARNWMRRWPINGQPTPHPTTPLDEVYNLVTLELKFNDGRLQTFKDSARNVMADGLVSADELALLDRTAKDLNLSDREKKKVLDELSKDFPELFQQMGGKGGGSDKLRLIGYRAELERAMSERNGMLPSSEELRRLAAAFRIEPAEHEEVLRDLRNPQGKRAERLRDEARQIQKTRRQMAVLSRESSLANDFLVHELNQRIRWDRDHILAVSNLYGPADELATLRETLLNKEETALSAEVGTQTLGAAAQWLGSHLPPELAPTVIDAVYPNSGGAASNGESLPTIAAVLQELIEDPDLRVRASAIFGLRDFLHEPEKNSGDADRQGAVRTSVSQALTHSDVMVQTAALIALAPDGLTNEQWDAALGSPVVEIRRCAVNHLPTPVPETLKARVERVASEDEDTVVRTSAAGALLRVTPRLADGHRVPVLTSLERLLVLREVKGLLAGLPTDALDDLARCADEIVFEAGEELCHQGAVEDMVYIVIDGQAEAVQTAPGEPTPRRLGFNRRGETVGEMAVLDPAPRSATVRALGGPVRTLAVRGEDFRALLRTDAMASLGLVRLFIQRMRQTPVVAASASPPAATPTAASA